MRFAVEPSFLDELKNLPPDRIKAEMANIGKFMATPNLPSLDFRALQSNPGYFLINAKHGDRMVLRNNGDDLYAAVDVGPHDNVLRRRNR